MKYIELLGSKAVSLVGLLFFSAALKVSFDNSTTIFASQQELSILLGVLFLLIVVAIPVVSHFLSKQSFLILLLIGALLPRLWWILFIKTPAASDFLLMYQSALSAARGDFSFGHNAYFTAWVYQLGFTLYEALVLKVSGEHVFALKLLNVMFSTGTAVVVYRTAAKLFNELSGRMAGIVYALYIPNIVLCSVLTNQHLSTLLFFLGFYLLASKGILSKYTWIYAGLLFSLGDIIRPLGSLVLLAVAVFLFVFEFMSSKKTVKLRIVRNFTGMVAVFFLVHYLVSYIIIGMGVTPYTLSNRDTLWKFVVGLNYESNGEYNHEDYEAVWKYPLGETKKREELKLIKERLADKEKLMELFENKFRALWGKEDNSLMWSLGSLNRPYLLAKLMEMERVFYVIIMALGTAATLGLLFRKCNGSVLLYIIFTAGYVAAHLLIENQTRYRIDILPGFIIIQSYGASLILSLVTRPFNKKRGLFIE